MSKRLVLLATLLLAGVLGLTAAAAATGKKPGKSHPVTVFKLNLDPRQEVPPVALKADARGSLTLDVTRDATGNIVSGKVVFHLNYRFPGAVTITGLHVHQGARKANGPIVVDSGIGTTTDADGAGNLTSVVPGSPATLTAILASPRGFYVNLHTSTHPGGALRDQLNRHGKHKGKHEDKGKHKGKHEDKGKSRGKHR
ncbi:MAG: CHRD domain-containing protein [Gaiellaceae bacterium]